MFLGEFEHTIDEKSRLRLPARFREALAGVVVITPGLDGCLDIYPRDDWNRLVEARITPLDPFSREGRTMKRFFFTGGAEAELDKQGRVLMPPKLLARAGIEREVVVTGVHDHLEIWDRSAWETQLAAMEGSADDVAERLAERRS